MSLLQPSEELGDEIFGLLLNIVIWEPLGHDVGDLDKLILIVRYWDWFDIDFDDQS